MSRKCRVCLQHHGPDHLGFYSEGHMVEHGRDLVKGLDLPDGHGHRRRRQRDRWPEPGAGEPETSVTGHVFQTSVTGKVFRDALAQLLNALKLRSESPAQQLQLQLKRCPRTAAVCVGIISNPAARLRALTLERVGAQAVMGNCSGSIRELASGSIDGRHFSELFDQIQDGLRPTGQKTGFVSVAEVCEWLSTIGIGVTPDELVSP